jgi:hypothetical protein
LLASRGPAKVIEYVREENRVLKAQLRNQRLRLTDGAWLLGARLSVVGCWRKWRRSSRRTPFCVGTASLSPGNGRIRGAASDGPTRSRRLVASWCEWRPTTPAGPLGERHLRGALAEYLVHYHREHDHQGIGNELIDGMGFSLTAAAFGDVSAWVAFSVITIVRRSVAQSGGRNSWTLRAGARHVGAVSADDKWMAYISDDSGTPQMQSEFENVVEIDSEI